MGVVRANWSNRLLHVFGFLGGAPHRRPVDLVPRALHTPDYYLDEEVGGIGNTLWSVAVVPEVIKNHRS